MSVSLPRRVYKNLMQLAQSKKPRSDKTGAKTSTARLVCQVALGNISRKAGQYVLYQKWVVDYLVKFIMLIFLFVVKYGKEACELFHCDKLATTLWSNGKKLNPVQIEAVELALQYNFQLIQGPPGQCMYVHIILCIMYMYLTLNHTSYVYNPVQVLEKVKQEPTLHMYLPY